MSVISVLVNLPSVLQAFPQAVPKSQSSTSYDSQSLITNYLDGRIIAFDQSQETYIPLRGDWKISSPLSSYFSPLAVTRSAEITSAIRDHLQFVVLGDIGAGKTTTLRAIVASIARSRRHRQVIDPWLRDLYEPHRIPIPLSINLGYSQNPTDIDELLSFWWSEYHLPNSPSYYTNNHLLWLFFDGLNEMPNINGERDIRVFSLRAFLQKYFWVRVIITCREDDYELLSLNLPIVRIIPLELDDQSTVDILTKRFPDKQTYEINALINQLRQNNKLHIFCQTPHGLSMLADIFYANEERFPVFILCYLKHGTKSLPSWLVGT